MSTKSKITKNSSIYFFLAIVLLIAAPGIYYWILNDSLSNLLINSLAVFSLFLLPIILFRNKLKWYSWSLFPIIFLGIINSLCIYHYHMPINDGIITVAINTNKTEFTELANGFWLSFFIITAVNISIYFFLISKVPKKINLEVSMRLSGFSVIVILILPFLDPESYNYFRKLKAKYYTVFPTSIIYAAGSVFKQYQLMDATKKERNNFRFNAKQENSEQQIHILVIGESDRRDHWSLYGYNRNTTPLLSHKKNLIPFTNIHSAGYLTEFSVPIIITGTDPLYFLKHTKQKSIISAFKEAGFETFWISNQTDFGHISIHAAEADNSYYFVFDKGTDAAKLNDDSELLLSLKKAISKPSNKKFIILKLQGSHYDYAKRYPMLFDVFKPSNKTISSAANDFRKKDIIINTYDNTVLHTDFILDSIINLVNIQKLQSTVFYISDHGENLFDDNRKLSQHASEIPSKYIAPIPFIIWYSDQFKLASCNKIEQLMINKNKKGTSQNLFYTFTEFAGIKIPGLDSTKSLSNRTFVEKPRFIIGGNLKPYNSDILK